MTKKILLGVSGETGSFSEEAGLLYAQKIGIAPELIYLLDMEGVLAAVERGAIDYGIFPVVNFRGGLVRMAFTAMGKHLFVPIDELWLDVQQCLLVRVGIQANQVTQIVSHPQGLAQCQRYLHENFKNVALIEWQDTAKAAKDLAQGELNPNSAIIASERAAHIYGLGLLAKNIQDNQPNFTAFIIVKKQE